MNQSNISKVTASAVRFVCLVLLVQLMAASQAATASCAEPEKYRASDYESFYGFSQAGLNKQGNLVITIDRDADGLVDKTYRIHLPDADQRNQALARWSDGEIELEVQIWTLDNNKVHRFSPRRSEDAFTVVFNRQKCLRRFFQSQSIPSKSVYHRTAISTHVPGTLEKERHQTILDAYDELGIFSRGASTDDSSKDPLICMAGGEGASSCSISFGGFGPVQTGSCSVGGCQAPQYACCGPGGGTYCSCVDPTEGDDDSSDSSDGDGDAGDGGDGDDADGGSNDSGSGGLGGSGPGGGVGGGGSGGGTGGSGGGSSGGETIVCSYDENDQPIPGNPSECPETKPNNEIERSSNKPEHRRKQHDDTRGPQREDRQVVRLPAHQRVEGISLAQETQIQHGRPGQIHQ